jgi:hypothetical protein
MLELSWTIKLDTFLFLLPVFMLLPNFFIFSKGDEKRRERNLLEAQVKKQR